MTSVTEAKCLSDPKMKIIKSFARIRRQVDRVDDRVRSVRRHRGNVTRHKTRTLRTSWRSWGNTEDSLGSTPFRVVDRHPNRRLLLLLFTGLIDGYQGLPVDTQLGYLEGVTHKGDEGWTCRNHRYVRVVTLKNKIYRLVLLIKANHN